MQDETGTLSAKECRVIEQAAQLSLQALGKRGEAYVCAMEEEEIKRMNRVHRGIDEVTDVLSFPAVENGEEPPDGFWGDILLCPARARVQAEEYGHGMLRELAFLTVHGMLHLMGYDHMTPPDEANMRQVQRTILERMGQTI